MHRIFLSLIIPSLLLAHDPASKPVTPGVPIRQLGGIDQQFTRNSLTEYPDVCIDRSNTIWIAYTELDEEHAEVIVLKRMRGEATVDSFIVSTQKGFEYRPRLFCDSRDRIWVVWAARRDGNWDIYARTFVGESWSDEVRVTEHEAVDIHPSITGDRNGNVWIVWESLRNGNFDIYATQVSDARVGTPFRISESDHMDLRPAVIAAGNTIHVAWDRQIEDSYRIMLRSFDRRRWGAEQVVSPEKGFNMAPALAVGPKGELTVAWHSTLRLDGRIGITPWVYLNHIIPGGKSELWSVGREGDQFKQGEDQGLEFPTLTYDARGRLWIFARPSQGFVAQCLDGNRLSPLYQFEVEGWGGRGDYVRAALAPDGSLYSVRRDIRFIYLHRMDTKTASPSFEHRMARVDPRLWNAATYAYHILPKQQTLTLSDGRLLLFGDIHQHSALSDGMGTVDQCYTRSKYVYRLDFAALSDHEWFVGNLIIPSEWEWIKIVGRQFDREPEFITFAGYEWTTPRTPAGFGHKNVYFADWDRPVFSFRKEATHTNDLFQLLKLHDAIAIPHHIGWTGVDWEHHDELAQPNFEMVSAHGAFEYMGNEPITHRGGMAGYFVQDGLARGLKFGLLGSSDGHGMVWHHGIARMEDEWQTGLTGVVVHERTKKEIMDALRSRRVYATSGTAIQVEFRMRDRWMGESLQTDAPPEFFINVEGTGMLRYVTLVRDNRPLAWFGKDIANGRGVRTTFVDRDVAPGKHWYYLRILQEDGQMAWSSPIWVEVKQ